MSESERNTQWAIQILESFVILLAEVDKVDNEYDYMIALDQVNRSLEAPLRIIEDMFTGEKYHIDVAFPDERSSLRTAALRAVGKLQMSAGMEANWPSEFTIEINTRQMHPWVWGSAKAIWEIGRYSEALRTAAVTVNARLQEKLDRDDMEFHQLARNAFSFDDPTQSDSRLRFPEREDWNEKTSRSRHEGAAALGECMFKVWRNVPSHNEVSELPEELAVEALAVMSTFARWVDEAEVVHER